MNLLNTLILTLFLTVTIFTAKVIRVTDGGNIVIQSGVKEQIKVRLDGINCPQSMQNYITRAKQATSDFIIGKEVRAEKRWEIPNNQRAIISIHNHKTRIYKVLLIKTIIFYVSQTILILIISQKA